MTTMTKWWIVFADDPDIADAYFNTKREAQEWADSLPCGYYIEHI